MLIYLAMMKVCYLYSHEERISDYNSEVAAGCQDKASISVVVVVVLGKLCNSFLFQSELMVSVNMS